MGATPDKRIVKTKKEISELMSQLYTEVAWKEKQACDSMNWQDDKEEIFKQYAEIRSGIQDLIKKLAFAGGFE